jgi:1,4-alpha-glucan branching enzyme
MFLFGEEVGAENDFLYGRVLENREDLLGKRNGEGKRLFEFYRQVIRTRLGHAGLRSHSIEVVHVHNANRMLAFRRWDGTDEYLVLASLNNRPFGLGYTIQNDRLPGGVWREILNSDAELFGGDNVGNAGGEWVSPQGQFSAVVPANGLVVFQKVG